MSEMRTSRQKPKSNHSPDFKSVFIVDPVKGERLHLAKLLKQEKFLMMAFEQITDCLKQNNSVEPDLVIYVLRKNKNELNQLKNIKKIHKTLHFVVLTNPEVSDLDLAELKKSGFTSIYQANNQDMVKNFIYTLMPECQPTHAA